jgi:hypothetical protein
MAAAIGLRSDFTGDDLRRLARSSRDAKQVRRLLALAVIVDGGSRTEAARVGGVGLQIVRDWVVRFNAEGPDGLIDRKAPGKPPTLTPAQRAALAAAVEAGPEPWRDQGGLRGGRSAEACEGEPGCPTDAAASGAGGDLRRRLPYGGGTGRWCHLADHPGLGAAVQRGGPAGADRPQGARKACAPAGGTSRGARRGRRGGAEAVSRWGGSLAPRRPRAVALGALRAFGQSADPGPGVAGDGLCQALRPAAALRAGSGGRGPVQKSLPDAVAAIRARLPAGTPVELWFQML